MKRGLLLFLAGTVFAANLPCRYEAGKFRVQVGDQWYEQRVTPNAASYALTCGERLASLYDGLEWTVFDSHSKAFQWKAANKDFSLPTAAIVGTMAAIYEGGNLIVYDNGEFKSAVANPRYSYAKLAVSGNSVGLYDGESLHAYVGGRLLKEKARARTPWARVIANVGSVYCNDGTDFFGVTEENGVGSFPLVDPTPTSQLVANGDGSALCNNRNFYLYCRNANRYVSQAVELCDNLKLSLVGDSFSLMGKENNWKADPLKCSVTY